MRLGSRGSALALAQARSVAGQLQRAGHGPVEVVTITTAGDHDAATGDKSRWTGALERALAVGEIDLAVHSAKDVPGELGEGLVLLGAPARGAVEDVLCLAAGDRDPTAGEHGGGLDLLPSGTRVGTSSLRRAAQLRAARTDLEVVGVRGNIDTRLRKLAGDGRATDGHAADGRAIAELDAIVLARAGLERIGRESEIGTVLDPTRFVPAPGQGTLALQGRAGDTDIQAAVDAIADALTFACLLTERALATALDANCDTPLGAWASDGGGGRLHLRTWLGLPDGSAWVADELVGDRDDPESLGRRVAERMLSAGAGELLETMSNATTAPRRPSRRE
ncbi:MAG TPA: hydroxymethylbilane synthase [Solirubrobacteraceae bacterium]|nr:hydroxymethylbilane synthase [Solirubrobacteraceae bacterium]